MLVLSRKVGQKLVVGDEITIEVVRVKGNRVTLGLAAPKDVKVLRGELLQERTRPNEIKQNSASKPGTFDLIVEDGVLDVA